MVATASSTDATLTVLHVPAPGCCRRKIPPLIPGSLSAPVVTSHNGVRAYADVIGNLDDSLLRELAARGGLVGLHSAGWLIKQAAADWNVNDPARSPIEMGELKTKARALLEKLK